MSASEIMQRIEELPEREQEEVFIFLTKKVVGSRNSSAKPWLGKKLSFEEACDVVFRENRELLSALAK
jgi:hypothetical protein